MLGPSSKLRRNLEMSPKNRGALPFQRKAIAATSTCHRLEDCFHLPTQLLGIRGGLDETTRSEDSGLEDVDFRISLGS